MGISGPESDLLVNPELVRQLDYMTVVCPFQLKISYSILSLPSLAYPILSLGQFVPGSDTCSPRAPSSVTAASAPAGFCCRQACLRLRCTVSAAFLCISCPAEHSKTKKWRQVTRWLFACDGALSHATRLRGQPWHDMLCTPGRGQSATAPLASLQTAPTPWCSLSRDSWTKRGLFLIYSSNLQWIILGWFINMKHVSKRILYVCHRWKN